MKAESAAAVEQIAGVLKANGAVKLYVVGHTDNVGAHEYNWELSRKWAESVVRELTDRARNRRVELVQR